MVTITGLIIGWVGGVIVNYFADILPQKRKLSYPTCQQCGSRFNLINYIFFPRVCKVCGKRRSNRTWLVELGLISLFLIITQYSTANLPPSIQFFVVIYFASVTIIDIEQRLILNITSLTGMILGLFVGIRLHGLQQTLIGGIIGYTTMLGLYFIGGLFISRIYRNRYPNKNIEALGFGDVTLGGVIGLFMGYPGIFLSLILAILSAGLISLVLVVYKLAIHEYQSDLAIPYGPFLVFGAFLLLFFNEHILNWINW